jgi:hypothetical protein
VIFVRLEFVKMMRYLKISATYCQIVIEQLVRLVLLRNINCTIDCPELIVEVYGTPLFSRIAQYATLSSERKGKNSVNRMMQTKLNLQTCKPKFSSGRYDKQETLFLG